jgi:polar amino acid transport system substrate-binding protein
MGLLPVVCRERTLPIGLKLTLLSRATSFIAGDYTAFSEGGSTLSEGKSLSREGVLRGAYSARALPRTGSPAIGSGTPPRENANRFPMARKSRLPFALVALAVWQHAAALTLLTEENPPFNYAENGKVTGLVTELVVETARRANVPYTVEMLPWNRAYGRAQAERDTCLFATARLPNREKLFTWVGPFASNLWAVYGRGDFAATVRTLADLKPYRIGGVDNDAKVEYLRENGITDIKSVADDRLNPPRLRLPKQDPDHVDLWVTGYYGARDVARAAKAPDVKLVFIVRDIPLYLACNPQTPAATVHALSDAVERIRAEGLPAKAALEYGKKFAQ